MPKCPMCEKEIDHLLNTCVEKEFYKVILDRESNEGYWDYEETSEVLMQVYTCPECKRPICLTDEDALIFLRG